MSSLDRVPRLALRLAAAGGLFLGLTACFTPLYGPTASGAPMREVLAAVEVDPISTALDHEYMGHVLRNELAFELDGSGRPAPKRFRLAITLSQSVSTPVIDSATGRADSASLVGNASFTLKAADGRVLTTGTATGSATYDRSAQRFADVRASRNAEERLGKLLADQIRTRIAAVLSAS